MKLSRLLRGPTSFFDTVRGEDWRPAFKFFLKITATLTALGGPTFKPLKR
ncbi:hypothetical protein J7L70_06475 [Candidatus Bathyarchaeota archaeon]|nr:hypothetical protein [Candidatus Bathyarchaeota archaeon]